MNKLTQSIFILFSILLASISCEKTGPEEKNIPNSYVNNWIYEQMAIYYYWNDKIPKSPDYSQAPEQFFTSLLYSYSQSNQDGDRFSAIRENYIDLLNSLGGITSDEIGFEYVPVNISPESAVVKQYYLLVLYPKLNTDAKAKGIKRGQFIVQVNDQDITEVNYNELLSGTGSKKLSVANWEYNTTKEEFELKLNPEPITVQLHGKYAESPIHLDTILTMPNDKQVGYLVYNFFATDKGDNSYTYDKELMHSLQAVQSQGAEEFILDLRYNGGGDVASAIALASALVNNRSTDNLLISMEFNPIVQSAYTSQFGEGANEDYFIDKIVHNRQVVAEVPALNLPRLYVLVSRFTASASELIINGLKPYMDVILIGETTVGKNVGSFVLFEEDDPNNKWAIMPITFKYFNSEGESDFSNGFIPDYEESEFEDLMLAKFGSNDDKLLGAALTHISTGSFPSTTSTYEQTKTNRNSNMKVVKNSGSMHINQLYDSRHTMKKP